MANRRVDGHDASLRRVAHKEGWGGFLSSIGQRFRLAASLMGFLNNPGPTRVRRSLVGSQLARTHIFPKGRSNFQDK